MRLAISAAAAAATVAVCFGAPAASSGSASTTYLGCGSKSGWSMGTRPADCFLDWPELPLARAVGLRHIKWSSWGGPSASGRALVRTKIYDPWTHVSVRASGRRACGKLRLYTRVRVNFGQSSHTWRTPGCAYLHVDD